MTKKPNLLLVLSKTDEAIIDDYINNAPLIQRLLRDRQSLLDAIREYEAKQFELEEEVEKKRKKLKK